MRSRVAALFWNGTERRPRLPWRLLLGAVAFVAVGLVAYGIALPVTGALGLDVPDGSIEGQGGLALVSLVAVLAWSALLARVVDRRRFADYGFRIDRGWWLDLAFGLALGAALTSGIFATALLADWVTVTGFLQTARPGGAFWAPFASSLLLFVVVGVVEELLFRGYLLSNLAEGLRWFDRVSPRAAVLLATIASAAAFGLGHAANPNATAVGVLAVTAAGVMLAAGYVLTGELGLPIGLHVAWNAFEASVYGFPVSGLPPGVSLVGIRTHGPEIATGGAFGPEAGLLGLGAYAAGILLIAAYVRRRQGDVALDPAVWTPDLRTGVS